jgi:SAM-dependent methyltransferase
MEEGLRLHWDGRWSILLACPICAGPLENSKDGEFACSACARRYPVYSRVPALLVDLTAAEQKTQDVYGDIWDNHRKAGKERGYKAPASSHIELLEMASGRDLVQGEAGIDAGCGDGKGTLALAGRNPGVRIIGIDLAAGIRRAAALAADGANVRFVQGNLVEPPLARHTFDFIYSFGVLHHTREPRAAFRALLERLRPGGRITLFVYKDFSDLPIKKWLLAPVTLARKFTTKLPATLLRKLAWCSAPAVFVTMTLPARFLRLLRLGHLAKHIPYGTFPGIRGIAASLEDRFGAPYEHRFSLSELQGWVQEAALEDARVVDCLPWGFSGLVLSGRMPRI